MQWYIDTLSGKSTTEEEEEDWTAEAIVEAAFKPTDAEQAFAYLARSTGTRGTRSLDKPSRRRSGACFPRNPHNR